MKPEPVQPTNESSPPVHQPDPPPVRDAAWPAVILAAQLLLSLGFLANKTLWLDEAYSAMMARLPLKDIVQAMTFDAGPPLYYLLLYAWRAVLGESETALRSLSLLFALAATAGVYQLAREAVDRPAAVLSTLLFAFSPLS
ncbi:MAG TPA: glycosyltransferase family 39 protein, partial [bacterium]|nr:glycosyltransferase family 39 protein [bacterium]